MNKLLITLFAILLFSCDEEKVDVDLNFIRYGSSFGECLGYCITDIEVTSTDAVKTRSGWNNSVTPKITVLQVSNSSYFEIATSIDQQKFLDLDPVIGCPDCADGGSEWVEIEINGRLKKVTFEYNTNPEGLGDVLLQLRALDESMNE
ncbi:MAG: hypothetical protein RIC03_03200 [Cyclobacteriaceae bacterium]